MMIPSQGNLPIALLSAGILLSPAAEAGSGTWVNANGGSWATVSNWAGNLVAGGPDANAGFSILNINSDAAVTMDGARTVGSLGFKDSNPSHNWFLNPGSGGQLTLDVTAGLPSITVFNQTATISVPVGGTKGFSKDGDGTLVLSGSNVYSGGTFVNSGLLQINGANALQGACQVSGGATLWLNAGGTNYPSALSGTGTVRISPGTGVAQLNGDLSGFSGILDIPPPGAGGKVAFSNISQSAALSPGAVVSVQSGATLYLGTTDTSVNVPAALELLGAGNSENLGALRIERGAVWSGPVTMKANSFIGSQNGSGGKILGSIRDIGGSFGFTKQGIQTLTLAGANTFSGTTVHNGAGSLTLANSLALQNSTLAYTGGGLMFDQGVASHSFTLGGLTGTAGITLRDNAASPAPVQLSAGRNNANTSFSGSLGGPGSFDKSGNGMLTLFGRNTYAGPTTVSGGTLRLAVPTGLPANLKIMPLGDSITYGFNGTNAGYRGLLYSALSPVAPNFQYVGSSVVNPGSLPASPVDQRHNEGHSSYTINDVSNNLDGFDNARFLQYGGPERNPNGGHWFDGIPNIRDPIYPDVITMMIGTNDVTNLTGIDTRLQDLIAKITTMRPSAKLLVAKISPLPDFQAAMETYNGIVENQVAGFQAAGKQVYLVDMRTGFPANGLDPDRVHPNDIGFTFMTSRWYDGIFAAFASGPAALPDNSPVTVAAGAMLDLNGTRAVVGSLSGAGFVSLGNGGGLVANITGGCAFGGTVLGSGTVTKTGTGVLALSGLFAHSGDTRITQGCLSVSGSVSCSGVIEVQSGAELELDGGTLTAAAIHICTGGRLHGDGLINAEVVNEGEITGADGQALVFTGRLRNHGLIRMTGGAVLQADGEFINSGTLDLITGAPVMAQNMSNSGQLLDGSAVGVNSFLITPEAVTVTVRSYTGHTYQLQHSADLSPESWQNAAAPQQGATGTTLSFQTTEGVAGMHGFYRIAASP